MNQERRYHSLMILFDIWGLIKNFIFLFILLFIFQANSDFWLIKYGRYALVLFFIILLVATPIKWYTSRYIIGENNIQLQRRFLTTSSRSIPYEKIQNVSRKTTLLHRVFKMTSLTLETSMAGDNSSITFHVLTPEEAIEIEEQIQKKKHPESTVDSENKAVVCPEVVEEQGSTLHFSPTKRDLVKASLTSFSFIAIIPIAWTLLSNFERYFRMEGQIEDFLTTIINSWSLWMIVIAAVILILIAFIFGGILTVLRFGRYEIASDHENVYITKGILEEISFTIKKTNVQAVSIHQSLMKRMLGLAEVRLISASGISSEDTEVNTLYPFLPKLRAYAMISEILPGYRVQTSINRLPREAIWLKMLRPSWFWIAATAYLFYFRPDLFGLGFPWWMIAGIILLLVVVSRLLSYLQTSYAMDDELVQFKTGGFNTRVYISQRDQLVELQLTRNVFQQKLGLSTIVASNRAKPVINVKIEDLPINWVKNLRRWFISNEPTN